MNHLLERSKKVKGKRTYTKKLDLRKQTMSLFLRRTLQKRRYPGKKEPGRMVS